MARVVDRGEIGYQDFAVDGACVTVFLRVPGQVYLASPYVVAASAIAGKIVEPDEFLG